MGFKSDYIFNQLKHNPKQSISEIISNDVLFEFLWYFVSKESYAQRIDLFDNIFDKSSTPYDRFFLIWLYHILELDELHIYTKNMVDLDNDVDDLSSSDLCKKILYIHANGITVFYSFFEKIRNSIAHGTFNYSTNPSHFFMIGQKSSKQNSLINLYYQTTGNINKNFKSLYEELQKTSNITDLCEAFLLMIPKVKKQNGFLYYKNKRIIVEHDFSFKPVKEYGSEISQIKTLVNKKSYNNVLIILCCVSHSTFEDDTLRTNNVGILPYNHIHSFFECNILFK